MSARLFFVRCSQAECEFGVLILIKGVNGRCWLCFVLFAESYNRVCCKGPGMTCGGDGKATWMCNFVVKLSETYRVTWREGGGVLILGYYLHLEVCHLFPYNNFNFWLIRGGVVKYNLRPPPPPPLPPSLSFSYAFASNYCKQSVFRDNVSSFCMPKIIFPIRLASNDRVDLTSFGQTSVFVSNYLTIKNWLMASLFHS